MTTRQKPPKAKRQPGEVSHNTEFPWSTVGVVKLGPETLTPSRKEQIEQILEDRRVELSDRDAFYEALGLAIACFHAGRQIRESSRPAAVRENLKSALDAACKLKDKLNGLDGTSRLILDTSTKWGLQAHFGMMGMVVAAHERAYKVVDDHPTKGGNLKDWDRVHLAVAVANAIDSYSNVKATTTKDGLYISLLDVVLEEALGKDVKSVHVLAGKALRYRAEQNHPDDSLEDGSATPNK